MPLLAGKILAPDILLDFSCSQEIIQAFPALAPNRPAFSAGAVSVNNG